MFIRSRVPEAQVTRWSTVLDIHRYDALLMTLSELFHDSPEWHKYLFMCMTKGINSEKIMRDYGEKLKDTAAEMEDSDEYVTQGWKGFHGDMWDNFRPLPPLSAKEEDEIKKMYKVQKLEEWMLNFRSYRRLTHEQFVCLAKFIKGARFKDCSPEANARLFQRMKHAVQSIYKKTPNEIGSHVYFGLSKHFDFNRKIQREQQEQNNENAFYQVFEESFAISSSKVPQLKDDSLSIGKNLTDSDKKILADFFLAFINSPREQVRRKRGEYRNLTRKKETPSSGVKQGSVGGGIKLPENYLP